MREITIKLYQYSELKDKAKEKAKNWFLKSDIVSDYIDSLDYDYMQEILKDELKINKITVIKDLKLFYSLSNSQGDGVCFIGHFKWRGYYVYIKHNNPHYYHERSTDITIETLNNNDAKKSVYEIFKLLYYSICKKIEKIGYEEIDYRQSEEYINENMASNEYEFLDDGTRF